MIIYIKRLALNACGAQNQFGHRDMVQQLSSVTNIELNVTEEGEHRNPPERIEFDQNGNTILFGEIGSETSFGRESISSSTSYTSWCSRMKATKAQ